MKKKILSILLCLVITATGAITANAAENVEKYKGFEILGEEMVVPDNVIKVYSHDVGELDPYKMVMEDKNGVEQTVNYKDCVNVPAILEVSSDENYRLSLNDSMPSGKHNFSQTGGIYKKIRIKLSEFSDLFDEDGTISSTVNRDGKEWTFIYDFIPHTVEDYIMDTSQLVMKSGAVISKVVPDENGEVEIYVLPEVGEKVTFYCNGRTYKEGMSFTHAMSYQDMTVKKLTFGNIDGSDYLDVNDVTYLQMYIAGMKKLDTLGMFHADTNCDEIYDVKDVTHLQLGLAVKK